MKFKTCKYEAWALYDNEGNLFRYPKSKKSGKEIAKIFNYRLKRVKLKVTPIN